MLRLGLSRVGKERFALLKINHDAMPSQSAIAHLIDYFSFLQRSNAQSDQANDYSKLAHQVDYF